LPVGKKREQTKKDANGLIQKKGKIDFSQRAAWEVGTGKAGTNPKEKALATQPPTRTLMAGYGRTLVVRVKKKRQGGEGL